MSTADIIIGPARVFHAAVGTVLPADSLAYGAAWTSPTGWTEIGLTKTPITMNRDLTTVDVMVEQSTLPVKRVATEEKVAFETTLAEITADLLQLAMGGTVTDTAAGASQVGKEELVAGGAAILPEYTWAIEGLYETAAGVKFPIRLQIYRATVVLNGELQFGKADATGIPLRIDALGDLTKAVGAQLFKFVKVLAAATS
ncbi:MAG: hypothetical protein IPM39_15120 [Chloroflexi bacterium]|nr:hypothetical protein [Chloroflexota bacterium]